MLADFIRGVGSLFLGAIGWLAMAFIGRPVRYFLDLRREAKQLTLLLWDAPESGGDPEEWEARMNVLREKRDRLTDISAEISSFAQSERFAVWLIRMWGCDPAGAGRAAKTLAFELGTNIEDRDKNYKKLDIALKYRFDTKRPFYNPYNPGR